MDRGAQARGTILIADDDESFVALMETTLRNVGYDVLTASSGLTALALARAERPDAVILDVQLPILNGYEVCRTLQGEFGNTVAIAFVSGVRTEALDVSAGLLIGADDYLVKPIEPGELVARAGGLVRRGASLRARNVDTHNLTEREYEVLRLLAEGEDQAEIAQRLSITSKTVATHVERILTKLGVHSRAQAIAFAYGTGLIRPGRLPQTTTR